MVHAIVAFPCPKLARNGLIGRSSGTAGMARILVNGLGGGLPIRGSGMGKGDPKPIGPGDGGKAKIKVRAGN